MELLTVNQVADRLGVHEKTIRRYINNGRLEAKKIGGQWRIEQSAFDKLIDKGTCCAREVGPDEMGSDDFCVFMDSDFFTSSASVQICTIVDYLSEDQGAIDEALRQLKSIAYDHLVKGDQVKVEYQYITIEKKARFVIWATPDQIGAFTSVIERIGK